MPGRVCCLVRALPGMLPGGKNAFSVISVKQLGTLDLVGNEQLVSHIFRLDIASKYSNGKVSVPECIRTLVLTGSHGNRDVI